MKGNIYIGTSNGHMPGNKLTFPLEYQGKTRLHYYSTLCNTIEVNSSFYKTPLRTTCEKWAADVPADFNFSVKLTRDITHAKELRGDLGGINHFLQAAAGIGKKKGCLLIQFPGKIRLEQFSEVEKILDELRMHDPNHEWRKAVEFRNDSWYVGETTELLDEYSASMVLHDFATAPVSGFAGHSNFVYLRFHGPTGNYRESYSSRLLDEKAEMIWGLLRAGKDVYVYFNNTAGGAFENARYLQSKFPARDILPNRGML